MRISIFSLGLYPRFAIVFSMLCLALPAVAKKQPDALYFSGIRAVDSMTTSRILKARLQHTAIIDSATHRLHRLGQTYRLTVQDAHQLVVLALLSRNADALHAGLEYMRAYSARDPQLELQEMQAFIRELYAIDSADLPPRSFTDSVIARLNGGVIKEAELAKFNPDWQAILLIEKLYAKDQTVRFIPDRFFRDSSMTPVRSRQYPLNSATEPGKWMAMENVDSINIETLAGYLEHHPFPGESLTGEHAAKLWVILRHGCGLLTTEDPAKMQHYLTLYRFLMPKFQDAASTGEFSRERYAYVHETLMATLTKYADSATVSFFAQLGITAD